jgi:hypothetical protein
MGECTECGSIFQIPKMEAIEHGDVQKTDTGSIKVSKAHEGATNTVKLSRASIGMVPDVKDTFKREAVRANHKTQYGMSTSKRVRGSGTTTGAAFPQQVPPPKPKKSFWQMLMFWKS